MLDDRKVFVPDGAVCKKCGGPIGFYKNERGNWVPCNIDGEDHWDDCRENLHVGRYGIQKDKGPDHQHDPDIDITYPDHDRPLYDGDKPPWD